MVECALCKREAPGSKPGFSTSSWSYSVMVITLDFESSNPGSNPGRTLKLFCFWQQRKKSFAGNKVVRLKLFCDKTKTKKDIVPRVGFEPTPTS